MAISRPRPREPPVTTTTSPLKSKLNVPIDASSVLLFHRAVLYISFVVPCLSSIFLSGALLFHQKESSIFDPFLSSSNLLVKQILPLDRDINNTSSRRRECHIFKKSNPAKLCLWCRMTQVLALCSLKPSCKQHPFSCNIADVA